MEKDLMECYPCLKMKEALRNNLVQWPVFENNPRKRIFFVFAIIICNTGRPLEVFSLFLTELFLALLFDYFFCLLFLVEPVVLSLLFLHP